MATMKSLFIGISFVGLHPLTPFGGVFQSGQFLRNQLRVCVHEFLLLRLPEPSDIRAWNSDCWSLFVITGYILGTSLAAPEHSTPLKHCFIVPLSFRTCSRR